MSAASELPQEEKARSAVGLGLCVVLAVVLFPFLFFLGWVTASPIYEKKDFVGLFVALRDGSYRLFSGRLFRSMILSYPPSKPTTKP